MLNKEQFLEIKRSEPQKIDIDSRLKQFDEIYGNFDFEDAKQQADRCLHCASPYCQWACPVHNYIPNWLKLVAEGNIIGAAEMSHKTNSLPEMCGRICPQDRLCEGACTLEDTGFKSVTIGAIEKFIMEEALKQNWEPDLSNITLSDKTVAIVGAGPAGLACADILIRNGVKAIIYDKYPEIGGLLTFGIPEFKLEKNIISRRRKILEKMGCEFQLNTEIGKDINLKTLKKNNDAVFLGMGTYQAMTSSIEGENAENVMQALDFLIDNINFRYNYCNYAKQSAESPKLGVHNKRVVVLGGGDTAMDCNRTSIRQGAKSVTCVYRRDQENMPGSPKEVNHAIEEGIKFQFNSRPLKILTNQNNQVTGIQIIQTQLGEKDENGRRQPIDIHGSETTIECDAIIVAFGFKPNPPDWLQIKLKENKTIDCYEDQPYPFQTSDSKVFAGGDMVLGSSLVVQAVYEGRKAAEGILDYLKI